MEIWAFLYLLDLLSDAVMSMDMQKKFFWDPSFHCGHSWSEIDESYGSEFLDF